MKLSEFYPLPGDFIQNEVEVLDYLANNTYFAGQHPQFSSDAKKYRAQYHGPRSGFHFASHLNVYHAEMPRLRKRSSRRFGEEPNLKLIVAGHIKQETKSKYGNISYLLAVGRIRTLMKEPGRRTYPSLLRKFHFDVTANAATRSTRRQEHPMCHLQYCGGIIPLMEELGFRKSQLEQMHEKLSEPRIFFWPMSLALLVDMALHEFPDTRSVQFRKEPEWRNIIRKNEAIILQPFHEKCAAVIRNVEKRRKTLADEFYVA
jgi:hypothetical protein